jgi:hypothetical protein
VKTPISLLTTGARGGSALTICPKSSTANVAIDRGLSEKLPSDSSKEAPKGSRNCSLVPSAFVKMPPFAGRSASRRAWHHWLTHVNARPQILAKTDYEFTKGGEWLYQYSQEWLL